MKKLLGFLLVIILLAGCTKDNNPEVATIPSVATTDASAITTTSAKIGGVITDDGGASIIEKGVCWNTSANPTVVLSTKTTEGIGAGSFISNITGLPDKTTFYVRAYATNSVGTAYGSVVSFTTITGVSLPSITIGTQTWTSKNLDVTTYSDGTPIPQVTDPTQWTKLTTGAWCYYNNDPVNNSTYGKLYNWYAVAGIHDAASLNNPSLRKQFAPTGWHVPTVDEWFTLTTFLNSGNFPEGFAGGKMKETGITHWKSPNLNATNSSQFTGLPGGWIDYYGKSSNIEKYGYWWSSSEHDKSQAKLLYLYYYGSNETIWYNNKYHGLSVRCLKDY